MSGWHYLLLGIVFEVAGTVCLKLSHGLSNLLPTALCFIFFAFALSLIALSAKTLDISIVYAVWSGIGVVLITLLGAILFSEHVSLQRLFFIALILTGVMGLHGVSETNKVEQDDVHTVK